MSLSAQLRTRLECHIDTEEANALGITPNTEIVIKKITYRILGGNYNEIRCTRNDRDKRINWFN